MRKFYGAACWACLVLPTIVIPTFAVPAHAQGRPNVVLIILDDMNDWVGVLGEHPQAQTPRIDALASEGVLLTNAHAAAPLCHPSRVSFMTGISPGRSGIKTNREKPWRNFLPRAQSLNQLFRRAGYFTAGFGKIYHGNVSNQDAENWDAYTPKPHGALPPESAIPLNGLDEITRGGPGGGDWGVVDAPAPEFEDHIVATWVEDFILARDASDPQPFFIALGLRATHPPWYLPSEYFARIVHGHTDRVVLPDTVGNDLDDVGPIARHMAAETTWQQFLSDPAAVRWGVHGYLAAGAFTDEQVGRVLDALDTAGIADNTIVVLLSDHGYHLGEKQTWQKNKLWEEDSRVPLIFRLPPGYVAATAGRIDKPVSIAAVFPTLLELAGIAPPNYRSDDPLYRVDYRSLVPLLDASIADASIAAQWTGPAVTFGPDSNLSLRYRDTRFTLYRDGFREYYDEITDAKEWFNTVTAVEYARRVEALHSDARRYLSGEHAPFGIRETCGAPDFDAASEAGMFVWLDCDAGEHVWHLRVTGGAHDSLAYGGELGPDAGFTRVTPVGLGADDVIAPGLTFAIKVGQGESAGLDFAMPDSVVCLSARSPPGRASVHLGAARFPVSAAVELPTLAACGRAMVPGGPLVGDYVWSDANGNGVQDRTETGVRAVKVSLLPCRGGAPIATTTTRADGRFVFDALPAGEYRLRFRPPAGRTFSPPLATAAGSDSNADPVTGMTDCMSLADGQARLGLDAGLLPALP